MPKKIAEVIVEDIDFLWEEFSKSKGKLKCDKIKTLIYIKEEKFYFQSDIGKDLERSEKTIRGWILEYSNNGYAGLLKEKRGGNKTSKISDKAVLCISEFAKVWSKFMKFYSKEDSGVSYDIGGYAFDKLILEIEEKHSEIISYDALYAYFKKNHKEEFNFLNDHFSKKREVKTNPQRSKKYNISVLDEYGFEDSILLDEPR